LYPENLRPKIKKKKTSLTFSDQKSLFSMHVNNYGTFPQEELEIV
jgi:hypothetical protein